MGLPALSDPDLHELATRTHAPATAGPVWWLAAAAARPAWQPVVVRVESEAGLLAAAVLARRRRAGVLSHQGIAHGLADHAALPAVDGEAAALLARAVGQVLARSRGWRLELEQLPAQDPALLALVQQLAGRLTVTTACPYVELDPARTLPEQLSRNGRRNLRNARNRLTTDGRTLEVRWVQGPNALRDLPQLQQLRRDREHALGRGSELDDRAGRRFHEQVARGLAERGQLEALHLVLDGALAAYALTARDGDTLRVWDGRVAPGHERYGLGWVSQCEVLARALATPGVARLDWMRGEQESKQRSATGTALTAGVTAWSSPGLATGEQALRRVGAKAAGLARAVVPPERRSSVRRLLSR